MFVDRAIIRVRAGNGGNGHVSFRREKFAPKGGPDGGDGGKGGDVYLVADDNVNTLFDFRHAHDWAAQDGEAGRAKQQIGADGADRDVRVPPGTLVFDNRAEQLIVDLAPNQRYLIAKGGKGGYGNEHYKTSTNQTPKNGSPGLPGDQFELRLDLKLIADVGLIGMPNAGKSTLLAAVTDATPKIGDYPFTTLSPQLGIAKLDQTRRLVLADIPGLIEGASSGAGLGLDFLRHIERTRVLVHLLDAAPLDDSNPADNYRLIRKELETYSQALADRREVIALNKVDLLPPEERAAAAARLAHDLDLSGTERILVISGATNQGTHELLEHLWNILTPQAQTWKAPAPQV
ncbi:MAG: GTPase ObgE [Phycisphaerales bacterium]|nr:GTPase ObgE [Phycisphaerales bacterium]